jgi:hypothetical protein
VVLTSLVTAVGIASLDHATGTAFETKAQREWRAARRVVATCMDSVFEERETVCSFTKPLPLQLPLQLPLPPQLP